MDKDERFLRNVDSALGNVLGDGQREPPQFEGKPGEPVPAVDPEDLKIAWQIQTAVHANSPGKNVAVDFSDLCKPGADVQAVYYRSSLVWFMTQIAPEQLVRFMQDGQPSDAVFRAAAKVPAEWMGVGIPRQGMPFDVNEFLRLCAE